MEVSPLQPPEPGIRGVGKFQRLLEPGPLALLEEWQAVLEVPLVLLSSAATLEQQLVSGTR
jgi:hypothetical protein